MSYDNSILMPTAEELIAAHPEAQVFEFSKLKLASDKRTYFKVYCNNCKSHFHTNVVNEQIALDNSGRLKVPVYAELPCRSSKTLAFGVADYIGTEVWNYRLCKNKSIEIILI